MNKKEYIEMLVQENNDKAKSKLYADVIDCIDIALSQEGDNFEVRDTSLGLPGLFDLIEKKARESKVNCVGPFEAAEIFAKVLGASYLRLSKRNATTAVKVDLSDFL